MEDVFINEDAYAAARVSNQPVKKVRKIKPKRKLSIYLVDLIEKSAIVALLLGIDFILFAGAGSLNVFSSSFTMSTEVATILIAIAAFSFVMMYLVSFSEKLQNLLVATTAGGCVLVLFNQFALFDKTSILSGWFENFVSGSAAIYLANYSHLIVAGLVALITFIFLWRADKSTVAYLVGILALVFVVKAFDIYAREAGNNDLVLKFEDANPVAVEKGKKFVFIGMPNLSSYSYLKSVAKEEPKAKTALNAMLGFYNNNDFTMYTNAFVNDTQPEQNMARSLNLAANNADKKAFLLSSPLAFSYWDFQSINDETVYLKDNKIFDTFSRAQYQINAYESHGLEMCLKNNALSVNKCLEKNNIPADLNGNKVSITDKTLVLFGQWLESTKMFSGSSALYSVFNTFMNVDSVALVGTSYDKLYVVNAFKTLDALAQDISTVKGDNAFFAYVDLPSDMYVYDEFCQLKPTSQWVRQEDLPFGHNATFAEKRKAYFEQLSCTFAKLEEFMTKVNNAGEANNVVVFIQGLSGLNDNHSNVFEDNLQNEKSVSVAIHDPLYRGFGIKKELCLAPEILKKYLYKRGQCDLETNMGLTKEIYQHLQDTLAQRKITKSEVEEASKAFNEWFKSWQKVNYPDMKFVDSLLNNKKKIEGLTDININAPKLRNEADAPEVKVQPAQKQEIDSLAKDSLPANALTAEETEVDGAAGTVQSVAQEAVSTNVSQQELDELGAELVSKEHEPAQTQQEFDELGLEENPSQTLEMISEATVNPEKNTVSETKAITENKGEGSISAPVVQKNAENAAVDVKSEVKTSQENIEKQKDMPKAKGSTDKTKKKD